MRDALYFLLAMFLISVNFSIFTEWIGGIKYKKHLKKTSKISKVGS